MTQIFYTPSLMLCLATASALAAASMTAAWLAERGRRDLALWSAGFWAGGIGMTIVTFRGILDPWLVVGIGNSLTMLGPTLFWAGLNRFEGRALPPRALLVGPSLLWLVLYFGVPGFAEAFNLRMIVASLLLGGVSLLTVAAMANGPQAGRFAPRTLLGAFVAGHGLVHLLRIPLAVAFPATALPDGRILSDWYAPHAFVLYILVLLSGITLFTFVRGRAEEKFRIAAETDPLTGILNRGAFLSRFEATLVRPGGGALALLDIDHFKRINDQHGHPAGDAVLAAFTSTISGTLPLRALFGRVGGEEFAVWLPDQAGRPEALGEAMRAAITALDLAVPGGRVRPTVSIGICIGLSAGANVDAAIAIADHALYSAKRGGRNRVITAPYAGGLAAIAASFADTENGQAQPDTAQSGRASAPQRPSASAA